MLSILLVWPVATIALGLFLWWSTLESGYVSGGLYFDPDWPSGVRGVEPSSLLIPSILGAFCVSTPIAGFTVLVFLMVMWINRR